jgi:hypothetical protein
MAAPPQVFLEPDDEIRGQKFICLSFLSPEKVLKSKEVYFYSKFLQFYALDYKVRATESFVMGQLRDLQSVLSDVHLALENLRPATDAPSSEDVFKQVKEVADKLAKQRGALSQKTAADLETHVKENMSDFRESTIQEAFDRYMVVNRQKLEDDFHKENSFRTTVRGLKCRGTYSTHEQASARAQQLHKKDPHFNVYVGEVGQWLPWDPEPDDVAEQKYSNEQLNTLMQSYRENATKRDEFFEEEKRQRLADAAAANAAKKASFGEKGKEVEAVEIARDLFEAPADIVIQRKVDDSISHA